MAFEGQGFYERAETKSVFPSAKELSCPPFCANFGKRERTRIGRLKWQERTSDRKRNWRKGGKCLRHRRRFQISNTSRFSFPPFLHFTFFPRKDRERSLSGLVPRRIRIPREVEGEISQTRKFRSLRWSDLHIKKFERTYPELSMSQGVRSLRNY